MQKKIIFFSAVAVSASIALAAAVLGGSVDFTTIAGASTTVNQAFPPCTSNTVNGERVVTPPTAGTNCNIQPDEQTISIYSIKLCTSKPSAPSNLSASNLTSCKAIFDSTNSTGSEVTIALAQTAALTTGTISLPGSGSYTHLYLELNPEVKIKSAVKFDTVMASTNGDSSGLYCWTKQANVYNFAMNNQGSLPDATECGSNASTTVRATSTFFNSLKDDSSSGGTGFVNTLINLQTTAGGPSTLDAFLIGTDSKLVADQTVNSLGNVKRVVGIITLPGGGVTVNASTTGLVIGYNNSLGAEISTQSGPTPSRISKFGNGPFDATVSTLP
jgi:hypothetical protein